MVATAGLVWVASNDGMTLKASGYPISIERTRTGNSPYLLRCDNHCFAYWTLETAKTGAERMAREIDEFAPTWNQR